MSKTAIIIGIIVLLIVAGLILFKSSSKNPIPSTYNQTSPAAGAQSNNDDIQKDLNDIEKSLNEADSSLDISDLNF